MPLRVFTEGLRILAAYMTVRGIPTVARPYLQQQLPGSLMVGHVKRIVSGVLLMLLSIRMVAAVGGLIVLVGVYMIATGIFRLVIDTIRVLCRNCATLFGALLLLHALVEHVVNDGPPAWDFAVMVCIMLAYWMAKGTLQLNGDSELFGMMLVLFGLGLHIVTIWMARGVVQFTKRGNQHRF
ncbi:uncharacterized protein LOC126412439 [Schistocerca serialis cubense]|uniref:uncharacterized protein LOC126412439 n=1 Tax=Schistocerca serialis cubense TaxID=2023355 RepID=UPI00214F012C|nr:uncharacterized protein LOC126412439 [Schistocerca serialis cubense]